MDYNEFIRFEKLINTVRRFKKINRKSSASISHKKRDKIFQNIVNELNRKNKQQR